MSTAALSLDQFQKALPKQFKNALKPEMIDSINNLLSDPELIQNYRDNLISYTSVLADGKFKIQNYIDAVRYVSFKVLGSTNINSYIKTFPDRYKYFIDSGASDKAISSYVYAYNSNKLVNLIYEQTIIPVHVLNADVYQKAINVQAELMLGANSEKVRSDAANSLLTHLKAPESTKIELDIGVREDKSINELRDTILALGKQQQDLIASGAISAKDVAHSKLLIDQDVIENSP